MRGTGERGREPFTDWDNPEDADDGAPEGYYGDGLDEDDESYVPQLGDPDYDLSEAAGYADWEPPKHRGLLPSWVLVLVTVVLILAILLPVLLQVR